MPICFLENKEKALYYADVLVKNDKQTSKVRILLTNKANFATNVIRMHTDRFVELKRDGF
jgi:lipopolysaccharide export system protein LptC